MNNNLTILYQNHPKLDEVSHFINEQSNQYLHLKGLNGSSVAFTISNIVLTNDRVKLIILSNKEEAAYFYDDFNNINDNINILFFPSSFKRSVQYYQPENENVVLRAETLNKIASIKLNSEKNYLTIITYPEALIEKVISIKNLQKSTLILKVKEKISIDFITEVLYEYHFQRVDFVYEPGQFSVRGSIVDIFSYSSEIPYRIDFFGNEVDTIRSFNIDTQLSKNQLEEIIITPNIQDYKIVEKRISFLEFLPSDSSIFLNNTQFILDRINEIYVNFL